MDAVVPLLAAVLGAAVGTFGGYILGNRRLKYEKLYERRAEVLAELTRRMFEVHHNLVGILTSPSRPHDRYDEAAEAGRLCFALLDYYSSNEVWLTPET